MTHWASPKVLQRDSLILTEHPMGLQMDSQTYWARLMVMRKDQMTHWASQKVLQRDSLILTEHPMGLQMDLKTY